jgi:hypothetical protein
MLRRRRAPGVSLATPAHEEAYWMSTDLAARTQPTSPPGASDDLEIIMAKRWRWQHYLTVVAVAFLVWEAWTLIAWLADGPEAITQYRDADSTAYTIAKGWEIFFGGLVVVLGAWVIRGCVRQRRLTFDAQLCIAGLLAYWLDALYNFWVPTVMYSSNFINVGSWCDSTPFVLNKSCGSVPEPLLILGSIYVVGFLLAAIVGGWIMRALEARRPNWSLGRRLAVLTVFAGLCGAVIDGAAHKLNLWNSFVSTTFTLWEPEHRYPLAMFISALLFFGGPTLVRHFKDEQGRTVFEQGLDHLKPRARRTLSFLSLVGFVQLLVFVVCVVVVGPMGLYAKDSSRYPDHIINGTCDIEDVQGTAYGPCPGTPGFKAPFRHLPNDQ